MKKIDKDSFLTELKYSKYGTGTLAEAMNVHPDEIHKMIHDEEAGDELANNIKALLGNSFKWLEEDEEEIEIEDEVTNGTVDTPIGTDAVISDSKPENNVETETSQTITDEAEKEVEEEAMIEGDILNNLSSYSVKELKGFVEEGKVSGKKLLAAERERKNSRITLLSWLRGRVF